MLSDPEGDEEREEDVVVGGEERQEGVFGRGEDPQATSPGQRGRFFPAIGDRNLTDMVGSGYFSWLGCRVFWSACLPCFSSPALPPYFVAIAGVFVCSSRGRASATRLIVFGVAGCCFSRRASLTSCVFCLLRPLQRKGSANMVLIDSALGEGNAKETSFQQPLHNNHDSFFVTVAVIFSRNF